ncbi:MAG: hypothetical protein NTW76_13770 [Corynebacteriales bacterium]|nr:hypothetical protein [Mycobacteriales bacterium]
MTGDPYAPDLMAAVFDYSPITKHVLAEAKVLMISPWALLGSCLAQAAIATPWDWLLPPTIGKAAVINPLVLSVGPSGAGKGIASAPVLEWPDTDPMNLDFSNGEQQLADAFTPLTPGSGEGISALFRESRTTRVDGHNVTTQEWVRRAAWIDFPEIDQLAAISSRAGATMSAEIRKVWSGEPLGTMTKVKANQLMVPAHSYRAVVTVGAQPLRCGPLLAEEAGGTLQRVLWLSADDPAPELRDEDPSTMRVDLPDWSPGPITTPGPHYFTLADEVRLEIRENKRDRLWQGTEDSHRNLVKLKAAAACAVLHGTTEITSEVWAWAEALMTHSRLVRASVRRELYQETVEQLAKQAAYQARTAITSASSRELTVEKVAKAIERWMRRNAGQGATANSLRQAAVRAGDRSLVSEALDHLLAVGSVVESGKSRTGTPVYKMATP